MRAGADRLRGAARTRRLFAVAIASLAVSGCSLLPSPPGSGPSTIVADTPAPHLATATAPPVPPAEPGPAYGLPPLTELALEEDDFEVRVWVRAGDVTGYVVRRQAGAVRTFQYGSAVELEQGRAGVETTARCDGATLTRALEALGAFAIPETDPAESCEGRHACVLALDELHLTIAARRGARTVHSYYRQPVRGGIGSRALALLDFLQQAIDLDPAVRFRAYPGRVPPGHILLLQASDGPVYAWQFETIRHDPATLAGELRFRATRFRPRDPGQAPRHDEVRETTLRWEGPWVPAVDPFDRFRVAVDGDTLVAALTARPVASPVRHALRVVERPDFEAVTPADLEQAFVAEAQPGEDLCRRFRTASLETVAATSP